MSKPKFEKGQTVIYQKGEELQIGIIKAVVKSEEKTSLKQDGFKGEPTRPMKTVYKYFVNYHTGDTAALTNERDLKVIRNDYAFKIERIVEK